MGNRQEVDYGSRFVTEAWIEGGCSAYGHSCFGGYGKRAATTATAGAAAGRLLLAAPPPLALPQQQQLQQREPPEPADGKNQVDAAELDADPGSRRTLRSMSGLRGPESDDATLIVLRQSPVSSRTPLWGRPTGPRPFPGDLDDSLAVHDSEEDGDPVSNLMSSRMFLRRWLRTYRQPVADRSVM